MFKSRIHYYLYTFCRYILATTMLSYAIAKIIGIQLTKMPSIYDTPVGQLSGIQLTWFYYGYSYSYILFIASLQILASLLLLFKKTTRIGAVLYLTIIGNILIIDLTYDIGAIVIALILTIMVLFILLSDFQTFFKFFIQQEPLFKDSEQPKWISKLHILKYFFIPLVFASFFIQHSIIKNKMFTKDGLTGAWVCEQINTGFDRLYFNFNHTFKIYKNCETKSDKNGEYRINNGVLTLMAFTKKYEDELDSTYAIVKEFDESKMESILKSKFSLKGNTLTMTTDSTIYKFKKIR